MVDRKTIDEINEKTDIVALISSYVKLERRGKNYFGLCPFHDDNDPSMSVSPEKNIFKCFACGEGGSPLRFYQKINNVSFNESILALAEPLGIKVDLKVDQRSPTTKEHEVLEEVRIFYEYYLHNSETGTTALKYLEERGLDQEAIEHFNIGLAPQKDAVYPLLKEKGFTDTEILNSGIVRLSQNDYRDFFNYRIMFPITDERGRTTAFSGRALGDATPKYYNSPETSIFKKGETLYHLFKAANEIQRAGNVILHEGYFDCIASYLSGVKNTVATMGTALTLEQAKLLASYTKHVIIAFDGDNAGVNATLKAIDVLNRINLKIDVLIIEDQLDPDDYLKKHGKKKYLELFKTNIQDQYQFIYETTKKTLNLKNANDIIILKETTRKMLTKASRLVKEIYLKRLSKDLNVSLSSLQDVLKAAPITPPPKPLKKKKTRPLPLKYYRAENFLFINMLKDKATANRIEQALGGLYVCDMDMFKLRSLLCFKFYDKYDEFDEQIFKGIIEQEKDYEPLLDKLNEILTSVEFKSQFIYNEEQIDGFIEVLKQINTEKKYRSILKEIKDQNESFQKALLIGQQKDYKIQLTKNKK